MNAIVENTVEQVIVENVEQVVENVVEQIVENVEMPMTVTEKVAKKSVKPSFVTAAHFKQMTVIYYVMKQMEMMNMVSAENVQSMKQLIGIGVSGETIKTFYDELNNGLEHMSELLAAELEASKPEKKRRATKKVVDEKPKSIVDALIEIANSSEFPVEPLTVAPVAVTVNAEDKPKRKYTKKPKAEQAVEAVASVEGEQVVNTETVAVEDKPKRKYTKKPKAVEQVVEAVANTEVVEQVVEQVVNTEPGVEQVVEQVVNTEPGVEQVVAEKPKRKYAKKPKAVEQVVEAVVNTEQALEQVVEAVVNTEAVVEQVVEPVVAEKPKAKKTKKPKTTETEAVVAPNTANTEVVTSETVVEKPKKAKKTKAVAVVEQVVETETVVADELTKESYDEECSMMVTTITVDGVEYLWDENTDNVYDANTETCIGKMVNNEIVKN
jgi:hypothetical protein